MDDAQKEFGERYGNKEEEFSDLGEDPVPGLIIKLSDTDIKVRWKAAWRLGYLGDPRAVEPLIHSLDFSRPYVAGEDEFTLNMVAAWALGRIRDPRAVEPLIQALSNPCDDFVWIAAWALGEIGDTRAIAPLEATLQRGGFECVWAGDSPPSDTFWDPVEHAVLDSITGSTFHEGASPVVRALEKLGSPF
ncbi:MAG: HEAT repeat domain-containing protein [Methanomicrobiales archaeon]|nr:HEAT repeat domain-containing protein [Methanomicrobiales archaeon]MDI6877241.1 HEAT repeat domain-containing protein [Methanomicrobiales archaeon]